MMLELDRGVVEEDDDFPCLMLPVCAVKDLPDFRKKSLSVGVRGTPCTLDFVNVVILSV